MAKRALLSIDGGGIRGIIPAKVIAAIEARAGASASELFDIIVGTSTGGIIALGLAAPNSRGDGPAYSADAILALYEKEGHRIFSRSAWHTLEALGNLAGPKYPADGIEAVMQQYFGARRLSETRTSVMVTAYEIERRMPFFFRSWRAKVSADYDFPLWMAACSTAAAPTYFPPIPADAGNNRYALVDGGVFANNPTMCAYVDAISQGFSDDQWTVVSLGTGNLSRPIRYEDARGWGLAAWAHPLIDVLLDGVADTVDFQMKELLSNTQRGRYVRLQTDVPDAQQEIDDARPSTIETLKIVGDNLIAAHSDVIDRTVSTLRAIREEREVNWLRPPSA